MNEKRIHPLDLDNNVAIGMKLPITNNQHTFFALNYTTADQAKTNLKNLILTNKGERIMYPTYGCNLRKRLFETNIEITKNDIQQTITSAVEEWLPYINVISINVLIDEINEHKVNISIKYNIMLDTETVEILDVNI